MNLHKKLLCTAGIAFLLSSANLFAAEQSAKDVVNKAYQYIGSMDKYTFDAVVTDEEAKYGEIVKTYRQDVSVKVDRPGKLRVDTKGDKPLVKTFSIIDTTVKGNPRRNTSLTWNTDPKITESDFIFTAPKGASKISVEAAN